MIVSKPVPPLDELDAEPELELDELDPPAPPPPPLPSVHVFDDVSQISPGPQSPDLSSKLHSGAAA